MKRLIFAVLIALPLSVFAGLQDIVTKGATDRSVTLEIIDDTTGVPETGVVYNTSGIDLWYRREGAAKVSITEATLAALTTAHTDGGFLHVSDGTYRLDLPDAAFAAGANYVDFGGTVTGMVVIGGRIRLSSVDLETAVPTTSEIATAVGNIIVEPNGSITLRCANALLISRSLGPYISTAANPPFTTTFKDPSNTTTRVIGSLTTTSLGSVTYTCPP